MQYKSGRFSPYGDELYPVVKFLSENGQMQEEKWTKVKGRCGIRQINSVVLMAYAKEHIDQRGVWKIEFLMALLTTLHLDRAYPAVPCLLLHGLQWTPE